MKNITFKNIHKVLIGMLVLAVLMISIVAFISAADTTRVALAEGDTPDSVWQTYLDGGYEEGMQFDQNEMVVSSDNPIVQYVPKRLFVAEGYSLYIGDEYGYYIYTFEDGIYEDEWHSTGNMRSIVLGFEITFDLFPEDKDIATKDAFSYTIEPIFQREYLTLLPDGAREAAIGDFSDGGVKSSMTIDEFRSQTYNDITINCVLDEGADVEDGLVTRVPHQTDASMTFADVQIFYLKNIAISANLLNEQELNVGDSGYDVADDEGSFFIGVGTNATATRYEHDSGDVGHFMHVSGTTLVREIIGCVSAFIPQVAWVGCAWDMIAYILNVKDYLPDDSFVETSYNDLYLSDEFPNSKSAQLEQGGGLYRSAAVAMAKGDADSYWFGVGNKFTAGFEVSNTTGNTPGWRTVVERAIDMTVTSLLSDLPDATSTSDFYADTFNIIRIKSLAEDVSQEAYIMAPDGDVLGEDWFSFVPTVTGFYSLEISGSGVDLVVTDEEMEEQEESGFGFFMEEGEIYYITLSNTTSTLKRPTVEVSLAVIEADYGDSFTFTLPAGEDVVIGVDLLNAFTNVSVNGTGAEIVAYIDNNGIAHTVNHNSIDLRASDVERLVIEVAGNSEQTVTLAFSDLPEIVADGETQVTVDGTINYFKFVPQAGNYFFIYTASEAIATTLHTEDGSQVAVDSGNDMYVVGLTVGETYWLMLNYTGHGEGTIGIETISFDGEYEWRLDDKLVAPSEDVFVYEGKTYAYSLLIDGEEYTVVLEKENDQYSGQVAVPDDPPGEITISGYSELFDADHLPEVNLYYTIRRVDIGTGVTEVKVYLDLILFNPLAEIAADPELLYISETMSYEDYVDVTVTVGDEKIESFDYYVSYQSGLFIDREHSGTVSVNGNSPKFSFDCADLIVYAPKVMLTGFVYDGYYFYFPESRSPQETFSVIYGKGSGTEDDPYYINTYQHFLTYALDATSLSSEDEKIYWALGSDIDISQGTLSVNEFYGELDGKKHTISGLTIDIGTDPLAADTSFGWVEHNYGKICNVTFADVNVTGGVCHTGAWAFIGVVAGINEAGGVINNVSIENANISVDRNMARIGGLVGVNEGTISDCVIGDMWFGDPEVSMFSNADMGIICGENGGTVDGCKVHFVVINYYPSVANRSVGGIVGYCRAGTIRNCTVWLCKIVIIGTDAGICPNIGSVAGHVANSNMLVNNSAGCVFELDLLTDAQKVNCGGTDRQYGYEG